MWWGLLVGGNWCWDSKCVYEQVYQKVYVIYSVIGHLICCLVVVCDACIFHIVLRCLVFYFWVSSVVFPSVSYTHLDVYKRQECMYVPHLLLNHWTDFNQTWHKYFMPVSYTHLDVYKRQVLYCSESKIAVRLLIISL